MARTIELTVYKFEELDAAAKQKVLDKYYDINLHDEWWGSVYDDAESIGIKITSSDAGRHLDITGEYITDGDEVYSKIIESHGENCETYKLAKVYEAEKGRLIEEHQQDTVELDEELDELEKTFLDELLQEYWYMLERNYHYLMSEEAIVETLDINGYEFTVDGHIINYEKDNKRNV